VRGGGGAAAPAPSAAAAPVAGAVAGEGAAADSAPACRPGAPLAACLGPPAEASEWTELREAAASRVASQAGA